MSLARVWCLTITVSTSTGRVFAPRGVVYQQLTHLVAARLRRSHWLLFPSSQPFVCLLFGCALVLVRPSEPCHPLFSFYSFILYTGSYNAARAGLEPSLLLSPDNRHSQRDTILTFLLQMGTEETGQATCLRPQRSNCTPHPTEGWGMFLGTAMELYGCVEQHTETHACKHTHGHATLVNTPKPVRHKGRFHTCQILFSPSRDSGCPN